MDDCGVGGGGGDADGGGASGVDDADATDTAVGIDAGVDAGCDCTTINAGVCLGARLLDFKGVILAICCGAPGPLPVHPFWGEIVRRRRQHFARAFGSNVGAWVIHCSIRIVSGVVTWCATNLCVCPCWPASSAPWWR